MSDLELQVRRALQTGLPIVAEPYAELARELEVSEAAVIATIEELQKRGLVKRFGMILRHRELGYTANAMVVWDIPDDAVDGVGARLAGESAVTLCYRRPRRLPEWPYNLFCMIHGKSRDALEKDLARLVVRHGYERFARDVLFSTHCYKQRGGIYV